MKRCIWILVCFLCISAYATAGQLTCTVRVVDINAKPVVGAEVAVYEKFYDYSGGEDYTKLLDKIKKTDANGNCVLHPDIESQYNVFIVARKKGLALGWDGLNYSSSNKAIANFNIILEPPCALAGKLVDETGNPVAEAKVHAVPKTSYLQRLEQRPILAPEQWFTTQTDAKGNFHFDNFAADVSSDFWVQAPGWASVYKYTTHWLNGCGFVVGQKDVRLIQPPEVPIQGRVVDADTGKPVAGIHLLIRPDSIREHENPYCPIKVVSSQDGQFRFDGVPPGKHQIKVFTPQSETAQWTDKTVKIEAQAGQTTKEVTIELEKGNLIEVVVREATTKKPISDASVYFRQAVEDEQSGFYKRAKTNARGMLRVRTPQGKYKVHAYGAEYVGRGVEETVTVAKGQTSRLEILLDRNPSVSGIALDESGQPVAGAAVKLHPSGNEVLTDTAGKFEASLGDRGEERWLLVRHMEHNLATAVEIEDVSKPIKVTLRPALTITGQVTDSNGAGIPAARFSLSAEISNYLCDVGAEVLADAQGRYEIKTIPPAQEEFKYRASVNASGYGPVSYNRVSITGRPGTSVEMETFVLQPADESISGVVVDPEGKPAPRVPIFLHSSGQPERTTATDVDGRFVINRICKGQLRLQANFDSEPGGAGSLHANGGDKDVKIILGQTGAHVPQVSLMGKTLLDLKELNLDLSAEQIKDKMILLCFWDMQQRPSRHCIRQLVQKAEELKQKGVTIVAVQASPIDENTLNEWTEKYNILFPVGIIEDDEEKTRFDWGVKSLPWLILTDTEHIVRAEGFAPTELDEKIKQIVPKTTQRRPVSQPIKVGQLAPDFELPRLTIETNEQGKYIGKISTQTVKLSSFRGKKPAFLIFSSYT